MLRTNFQFFLTNFCKRVEQSERSESWKQNGSYLHRIDSSNPVKKAKHTEIKKISIFFIHKLKITYKYFLPEAE